MASIETRRAIPRYGAVAMLLHWLIAGLILFQIGFGLWMSAALEAVDEAARFAAYETVQTHKAIGLTVLALSVLRLAWRLTHPAPPLPLGMPLMHRAAAHLSHWAFYVLMLGMPLTGWAMVSSSAEFKAVPTTYFDLFLVPHLPEAPLAYAASGLTAAGLGAEIAAGGGFATLHAWLAYGAIALLALHVGAALRHHFVDRDTVLARMVPRLAPRGDGSDARPAPAAGALGRTLAALLLLAAFGGAGGLALLGAGVGPAGPVGPMGAMAAKEDVPRWRVDPAASRIRFGAKHSGAPFEGVFERWRAEIAFDVERLDESRVRVEIETASAVTGEMQYDGALPSADWLDAPGHPLAVFVAERFRVGADPAVFLAEGVLTLRGVSLPFALPFTLEITGERARVVGAAVIDRLAFGVGAAADADAAWVTRDIDLRIELEADRLPPKPAS